MKFNEFLALEAILESEGSNIEKFMNENLNEAGQELETGRAGKGFHSPRFALKRKKLDNNAKKFMEGAKSKIIDKYAPKILESTKNLISKAAALTAEGKTPTEINKLLGTEAKKAISVQEKSIERLDKVIDKVEDVYNKRVDIIIKDEKLSEKSRGLLEIYWSILSLQVRQMLDKALVKYREDMIEKAVGDNPEMEKMLKIMSQSPNWKQRMQEYVDDIEKQKKEYNDKKSKEEKPEELEKKHEIKVGQKYKIGEDIFEIREVGDNYVVVKDEKGNDRTYSKEKSPEDYDKFSIDNLLQKEKEEKSTEEEK